MPTIGFQSATGASNASGSPLKPTLRQFLFVATPLLPAEGSPRWRTRSAVLTRRHQITSAAVSLRSDAHSSRPGSRNLWQGADNPSDPEDEARSSTAPVALRDDP